MLDNVHKSFETDFQYAPVSPSHLADDQHHDADDLAALALPVFNQQADQALKLTAYIEAARLAQRQTKHSAAQAAVICYIVYRNTLSKDGAEWLKTAIETANAAIKHHNAAEKTLFERVDQYKAMGAAMFAPARTAEEAAQIAIDAAQLLELADLDDEGRNRRKKTEVAARSGTVAWTSVIKLVLELNSTYNASVTHRFATVVGWLARRFPMATDGDYMAMVQAILNAHGFDAVYADQIAHQRTQADGEDQEGSDEATLVPSDEKILAEHKAEQIKAGLNAISALGKVSIPVQHATKGYTLLLGRVIDGTVEIVGEADVGDKRLAEVVTKHGARASGEPFASSEFLWNLMSLGNLVRAGQVTKLTRHDLAGGEPLKVERRLVLRNTDGHGGYELMVTARYADSSVIVKATPNAETVHLGPPEGLLGLHAATYAALYELLSDAQNRALWNICADHAPLKKDGTPAKNVPAWVSHCDVLKVAGSKTHAKTWYLSDATLGMEMPLDVDGFRPQSIERVQKSDLVKLFYACLAEWARVRKADTTNKTITLEFAAGQLIAKRSGEGDFAIPAVHNGHASVSLTFRAQDLYEVFGKLREVNADTFTLMGDRGGLLAITWKDPVGFYQVYLPTAAANGEMQSRRVAPMNAGDVFDAREAGGLGDPSVE
ncbi:MAG: hypothetical protein WCO04_14285 [Pseudomonadota bacterium]